MHLWFFNLSKVIKFHLNYFVLKKLVICHTNRTVRNLEISVEQATITDLEYYSFFRVIWRNTISYKDILYELTAWELLIKKNEPDFVEQLNDNKIWRYTPIITLWRWFAIIIIVWRVSVHWMICNLQLHATKRCLNLVR